MIDWPEAASALEDLLEHAARLVDGEAELAAPPTIDLSSFSLSDSPNAETLDHIRALLAQVPDAVHALEQAKATIAGDLEELGKHRTAATAYMRTPVSG